MGPGEVVQVITGEHKGKKVKIKSSAGWYYHCQLLTESGRKSATGSVSLHRTAIAPLEK